MKLSDEVEYMMEKLADCINILGDFCGIRDVEHLTTGNLQEKYGIERADVMVLFGGSIISGGDVLAAAIQNQVAGKYVIVGGAGHTTETLRQKVHKEYPDIITEGLTEAEVFNSYLKEVYGLEADYLETESTNCGNNITNLLELLRSNDIEFQSIIICQDATMQHRMYAGLRKYVSEDIVIINYAAYQAHVVVHDNVLAYSSNIVGMWEMDRYVELLLGEIPRLSDRAEGYGPNGKNYIAHVDIPDEVQRAFETLVKSSGVNVREANPLYATKE